MENGKAIDSLSFEEFLDRFSISGKHNKRLELMKGLHLSYDKYTGLFYLHSKFVPKRNKKSSLNPIGNWKKEAISFSFAKDIASELQNSLREV